MNGIVWLLLAAIAASGVWLAMRARRKWAERERAEAERFAAFMAATAAARKPADVPGAALAPPAPAPAAPAVAAAAAANEIAVQKLLFEAAHRAGEAGEPALAIQLYARLLVRYPASTFAGQARAAVEIQKKKIAKA